jgi:hypothetical protein
LLIDDDSTGFDFSASVTMDMTEVTFSESMRQIKFKCVDSQFFSEFDGTWTVIAESPIVTTCQYEVNVRPKGPVPVAALEWRIREDVPTNLRAVKAAALKLGQLGSSVATPLPSEASNNRAQKYAVVGMNNTNNGRPPRLATAGVNGGAGGGLLDWDRDETMAKYL